MTIPPKKAYWIMLKPVVGADGMSEGQFQPVRVEAHFPSERDGDLIFRVYQSDQTQYGVRIVAKFLKGTWVNYLEEDAVGWAQEGKR